MLGSESSLILLQPLISDLPNTALRFQQVPLHHQPVKVGVHQKFRCFSHKKAFFFCPVVVVFVFVFVLTSMIFALLTFTSILIIWLILQSSPFVAVSPAQDIFGHLQYWREHWWRYLRRLLKTREWSFGRVRRRAIPQDCPGRENTESQKG